MLDGQSVVSHAEANFRFVEHGDERFKTGGVSAVFTYPAYRGRGLAKQVALAATDFLSASDADLAMLFCGESLVNFYTACGWTAAPGARIYHGEQDSPILHAGTVVMMRMISPRGRAAEKLFATEPVYVGQNTW